VCPGFLLPKAQYTAFTDNPHRPVTHSFDSPASITAAIDDLAKRMYYSEEHEIHWAARELLEAVPPEDLPTFRETFLRRLEQDPSLGNIFFAGSFGFPEAAPLVAELLRSEENVSQLTRTMMYVLAILGRDNPSSRAYEAIEPFLDSPQEQEALQFLAQLDFERSLPHLRAALRVDHHLKNCLHIFHARRRATDFETLCADIDMLIGIDPDLRHRFKLTLTIQQDPYNPFNLDERKQLLHHLEQSA